MSEDDRERTSFRVLSRVWGALFLILTGVVALTIAADQQSVLFEDRFEDQLDEGWSFLREDPDDWRLSDDGLQMRAQPGRVWAGDDAENVLLRHPPDAAGPIAAEITLSGDATEKWEQAGLLWYADDHNFVKLVREYIDGDWFIVMAREFDAQGAVLAKQQVSPGPKRLRLRIDGRRITGLWQDPDDQQWHQAAALDFQPADQNGQSDPPGRLGLFTQDGPADETHWVTFRRFRVLSDQSENENGG